MLSWCCWSINLYRTIFKCLSYFKFEAEWLLVCFIMTAKHEIVFLYSSMKAMSSWIDGFKMPSNGGLLFLFSFFSSTGWWTTDCCQGSLDKPPFAQWLYYSWHFPWPLQIHLGMPRVLQSICYLWPILLPHIASALEEGPYHGSFPGAIRPSVKTHTGELALTFTLAALDLNPQSNW